VSAGVEDAHGSDHRDDLGEYVPSPRGPEHFVAGGTHRWAAVFPKESAVTNIEIRSEIPSWEPCKPSVETAVRDAFRGLPGRWRVEIICSRIAERWMVRIDGPAVEWYLSLAREEQRDPEAVAVRVRAALRDALRG